MIEVFRLILIRSIYFDIYRITFLSESTCLFLRSAPEWKCFAILRCILWINVWCVKTLWSIDVICLNDISWPSFDLFCTVVGLLRKLSQLLRFPNCYRVVLVYFNFYRRIIIFVRWIFKATSYQVLILILRFVIYHNGLLLHLLKFYFIVIVVLNLRLQNSDHWRTILRGSGRVYL